MSDEPKQQDQKATIRIDPDLHEGLSILAKREKRGVYAQAEIVIERVLRESGIDLDEIRAAAQREHSPGEPPSTGSTTLPE